MLDGCWVLKWKITEGHRQIRARLTVRGFKDRQRDLYDTFAGTSTRWGQKAIVAIAVQQDWPVWSADVSSAFLRGQSFEQIAKETGLEVRSVQFDMPQGSVPLLRQIPGFETFDPTTDCLNMLKPVFGTNDAPWAWARELKKTLMKAGYQPTQADPSLYLRHVTKELVGALSTHVDDLKGTSSNEEKSRVVKIFEEAYGKLVMHEMPFEHWHHAREDQQHDSAESRSLRASVEASRRSLPEYSAGRDSGIPDAACSLPQPAGRHRMVHADQD